MGIVKTWISASAWPTAFVMAKRYVWSSATTYSSSALDGIRQQGRELFRFDDRGFAAVYFQFGMRHVEAGLEVFVLQPGLLDARLQLSHARLVGLVAPQFAGEL